eukprot:SAG11_NODE_767_length_7273_cov_3.106914_7_plen_172_part_00
MLECCWGGACRNGAHRRRELHAVRHLCENLKSICILLQREPTRAPRRVRNVDKTLPVLPSDHFGLLARLRWGGGGGAAAATRPTTPIVRVAGGATDDGGGGGGGAREYRWRSGGGGGGGGGGSVAAFVAKHPPSRTYGAAGGCTPHGSRKRLAALFSASMLESCLALTCCC